MKGSSLKRSSSSRRNRWSAGRILSFATPASFQSQGAGPPVCRVVRSVRDHSNGVARSLATQGRKSADWILQVLGVRSFKSLPATSSVTFPRETSSRAPQSAWATRRVSEPAENSCVGQFSDGRPCRQSVPSPDGLVPSFSPGFQAAKQTELQLWPDSKGMAGHAGCEFSSGPQPKPYTGYPLAIRSNHIWVRLGISCGHGPVAVSFLGCRLKCRPA